MNEKYRRFFALVGVCILFGIFAAGFIIGRGDIRRTAGIADTDWQLERTLEECKRELERERAISEELRSISGRERSIIAGIAESTRKAGVDIGAALGLSGGAAGSLQSIIAKMEIYNNLVRDIERRLAEYSGLPSDS